MALLLSGYYCCRSHLFDVTKYHAFSEVQHIADTPSVQMCSVWPHSPQVVFKADLTSFPCYWLKPQTAEKFYLTFLFTMNHLKSLIWI